MSSKKYLAVVFSALAVLLALAAAPIINIDPFMHYHMPKEEYLYSMYKPWYLNYGIIKNFDYNALITGTSMTDNFKTSEADAIFGTNTIKVPFDGASFKEIDMAVREACEENDNLKLVIRGLDPVNVFKPADYEEYGEKPTYLYDDIIFNDVPYIFNKEILINETFFNTIIYTRWGTKTSFDDYMAWYSSYNYGKQEVLSKYTRPEKTDQKLEYNASAVEMVTENIAENVINTAKENPNVEFYYFYAPYSIVYFDRENQNGMLEYNIDSLETAAQLILECDNIKLFSFFDNYDLICNLDNYKDIIHYSEKTNTDILNWMKEGTGLLTKDNYKQHFENMRQFYLNYDYDSIFE